MKMIKDFKIPKSNVNYVEFINDGDKKLAVIHLKTGDVLTLNICPQCQAWLDTLE